MRHKTADNVDDQHLVCWWWWRCCFRHAETRGGRSTITILIKRKSDPSRTLREVEKDEWWTEKDEIKGPPPHEGCAITNYSSKIKFTRLLSLGRVKKTNSLGEHVRLWTNFKKWTGWLSGDKGKQRASETNPPVSSDWQTERKKQNLSVSTVSGKPPWPASLLSPAIEL